MRRGRKTNYYEEKAKLDAKADGVHCVICGMELPKRRRRFCSDECREGWLKKCVWFLDWALIRDMALGRDKNKCQKCGATEELHVHHIKPIIDGGDEFNLKNTITLCKDCHVKEHKRLREDKNETKSNKTKERD